MANEFVARKGIIALSGGAQITGSLLISGAVDATGYDIIARSFTGSFSGSIGTAINAATASYVDPSGLPSGVVSSSGQVSYTGLSNIPIGIVSSSVQIDVRNTTGISTIATTGSNTFTGTQTIGGNIFLNTTNPLVYNNSANNSLLFGFYDGSTIYGPYYQIFGNNYSNAAQRGGAEFVYDTRNGGDGNFHVSSYDGTTWIQRFRVDNGGIQVTGSIESTAGITGSFKGDGSQITGIATSLAISGSTSGVDTVNLKTDALVFSGSSNVTATVTNNTVTIGVSGLVSQSGQIDHNATTNYVANEHVNHLSVFINPGDGLSGGGNIAGNVAISLNTSSAHFVTGSRGTISSANTAGASGINLTYNNQTGIISGSLVNSSVTVNGQTVSLGGSTTVTANTTNALTLGNGLTGTSFNGGTAVTTTVDTGSAHFITGSIGAMNLRGVFSSSAQLPSGTVSSSTQVNYTQLQNIPVGIVSSSAQVTTLLPAGTVSSSGQVDVRNTTGIATIATTGSNTFTDIQTISNTTNSTAFNNGALIVAGGLGVARDVNISGSLTVTGLLTAVSSSVQYVTSSQLNVADNKIVVNTNDLLRFGGLSVIDSGSSSPTTASIYWDSLAHHFIYENLSGSGYNSAIIIAGPKNTGALGNETELITGRVPVASGGDHIDTGLVSSSIRIDFPSRLTHIEAGLVVTGSITSSVGFSGDGSNLTGIVSTLSVTGSQGGQGAVNLKTEGLTVTGANGVTATVSGQTLTISGSNATTTTKGVASFNSTNFTVTGGEVTSNNITINGGTVTLGGTRNITLAQITTQGATTTDAVTLSGGATIGSAFQTSSTYVAVAPTSNEVVVSLATGSFDAAHFDYVVKSGTNLRTGTVMSIWTGASVEFTDTSTNDIGNTRNADFTVDTSAGNVRLKFTATSGTWTIKTSPKLI